MHFLLYLSLGSPKKETMKQPEMLDANVDQTISCFVRVVCDIPHIMLGYLCVG
jgi:hypothetical protein